MIEIIILMQINSKSVTELASKFCKKYFAKFMIGIMVILIQTNSTTIIYCSYQRVNIVTVLFTIIHKRNHDNFNANLLNYICSQNGKFCNRFKQLIIEFTIEILFSYILYCSHKFCNRYFKYLFTIISKTN